jgi:two-component system response regulator
MNLNYSNRRNEDARFRILLIEDTAEDVHLALRALRRCEFAVRVDVAQDGDEALQALGLGSYSTPMSELPDLIICDIKLPKVNGPDVVAAARATARFRSVPIVMFSSSSMDQEVERCLALGADEYYVKPIDPVAFGDCVRDIAQRWLVPERPKPAPSCLLRSSEVSPRQAT